jgi:Gly-Xaa carboxypeptidase
VEVETEGGHSPVPPDHTGVGILSKIISAIEGHPYEPELTPVNCGSPSSSLIPHTNNLIAYFTTLQCEAEYDPDMNPDLRSKIKGALTNKRDAKAVADGLSETDIFQRYLMQTSQATDLISGQSGQ